MLWIVAYLVLIIFFLGFVWRIWGYIKTPAPLKIPTTPAPTTKRGVAWRLFTEVAFFHSLFKGNKWTWLGGILFHGSLALVLLRHARYFCDPLPPYFHYINIFGVIAGIVMVGALGFLLLRRYWVERTRLISAFSDYGILFLLIGIGVTGLLMKFVIRPDIIEVKVLMNQWVTLQGVGNPMPSDILFLVHFVLVLALLLIFPFSKLMHMGGIFFSPTRNQADNPREVRHIAPWAAKAEAAEKK
ncbi:MAG: respiratory nitrate reductase subunit gamma [Magnetococcales bacterium]|nr:respiratory nitrate reductase subunit gamma [Magnetococcales bacterium]